jgi:prepilin-type N-terminal cleavage/methylation domain-containing protein
VGAAFRARRRRLAAGFTLMELMVVVILIAILALLAMPRMQLARDDRMAFNYARRIAGLIHRARTRAVSRGAAHLVVIKSTLPGEVQLFEAVDGTVGPNPPGPDPVSSCKSAVWTDAGTFVPGAAVPPTATALIVEAVNLNDTGVRAQAGIGASFRLNNANVAAGQTIVYCVTPYGATYVGTAGGFGAAITDMVVKQNFNDVLEITVQRGLADGVPVGLARRVVVAGTAAPRIHSK